MWVFTRERYPRHVAGIRCVLDAKAGSIWNDPSVELRTVGGNPASLQASRPVPPRGDLRRRLPDDREGECCVFACLGATRFDERFVGVWAERAVADTTAEEDAVGAALLV